MLTPRQGLRLLALGALAAMLTGCKVYWGVVQDDYIKGARVCVDLNENLTCDPTEPSTLTEGDYGRFRLASRDTGAPLLAEVTTSSVNTATGEAVTRPYTLVAPSSHPRSINPLTTLVYAKARAGGLSLADAEAAVADALGLGSILDRDYQEAQDDDASQAARELAEKLADGLALVDDSQTADARVRMTLAVLEQVERRLWDGDGIADVVMTKGDIYATDLDDPANPRNAAAYGGDVEVIAGTGFHGTLFDSADNKCQHCHNELYDTWKKSMHAQSWSDPIFQSKYQDFLRVHIAKIGATGPTGTYTEGTFKKVAQVCVKCHAPGAFYTGDLQVELQAISDDPAGDFADARLTAQANLAPGYDPAQEAKVVSVSKTGKVYQASYRIGNKHNREGINCAYCHSVETVRLMNDTDGDKGE